MRTKLIVLCLLALMTIGGILIYRSVNPEREAPSAADRRLITVDAARMQKAV